MLSSHLVADLERVCDYLVVLVASQVQLAGDVERRCWPRTTGCPGRAATRRTLPAGQEVIEESHTDKQTTLLVRTDDPVLDPAWTVTPVSLDDLVLAYMSPAATPRPARPTG